MTVKRATEAKTINKLIGGCIARHRARLRLTGTKLGERVERYLGEPWTRQTVSDAEMGRRAFRVSELIALAMALGVQAGELVDPADESQVQIAADWNLEAHQVRDVFQRPGKAMGPLWHTLLWNREVLDGLEAAVAAATRIDENLSRRFPKYPAHEGGKP